MTWTVIWKPNAEVRLTVLWTDGPDRAAIAAAADQIDLLLRDDPQNVGESREDGNRILIVPPLAIVYKVEEDDRMVKVAHVWRWGEIPS